ncbi:MAG: cytochrome c5 family protein [Rhodocyclaceae bacterium]|nr:cytochrome c5 family protein [Rhodocyclaceae bacterium]
MLIKNLVFGLLVLGYTGSHAIAAENTPFPKAPMTGKQVYEAVCANCHATGLVGAPKTGDKAAWKELIAEGQTDLVGSSLAGIRRMPPMGGEPALYDLEVAFAVNYMVAQAGGKFAEPTDAIVKAARLDGEKRARSRSAKARAARK